MLDHEYALAAPEIFLAGWTLALLMLGVFRGDRSTRLVSWLAAAGMAFAFVLVFAQDLPERSVTFAGGFVADGFARFAKLLILIASALSLVLSLPYIRDTRMERFEYPVLFLLSTIGMLMMVSANDLISLYLGLEVQSLSLYVIAAFNRDSARSTEAGLKYFVLGALSSGMLLYGCSMIYGFTGSTNFDLIADSLADGRAASLGLLAGIVFLAAGLAFKVSAVPFHMWTPDVYEGAPTSVTTFFIAAPKVAAMTLFVRALEGPFFFLMEDWRQIVIFISVASMLLGAFAAIGQANIKRMMAYSSIGHVGYALIGLAAGGEEGVRGVLVYLAIYVAMNIGAFAVILSMRVKGVMVEGIDDLAGLARSRPLMALAMLIFMFSLAGVPPTAGFFGKLYVFIAAINAELYALAVIGVLTSVVSAYYYLRVVKVMYFDEPAEPLERRAAPETQAVMALTAAFNAFFILWPAPLMVSAGAAAVALLP